MFAISILLWIIAIVLIIVDPKNKSSLWASATAFFSGCGGIGVFLDESVKPYLIRNLERFENIIQVIDFIVGTLGTFAHYLAPFALLMYSLCYSNVLEFYRKSTRLFLCLALSVPPALMYVVIPINIFSLPVLDRVYMIVITTWVAPYVTVAGFFLLRFYFKATDPKVKRDSLLTCIAVIPTTMSALVTSYILVALDIRNIWQYNILIICFQFIALTVFSFRYGIMGVKLKLEKQRLGSTIKAISSGTAILNHAIKNEVTLINMCAENINRYIKDNYSYVNENLNIIISSTEHLISMVSKIQENMKDIVVNFEHYKLSYILERSLSHLGPILRSKNIHISNTSDPNIYVYCDLVHISEVIYNILKNSVEAIDLDGTIEINTLIRKEQIIVYIKDNGKGISKDNLSHIFDPFFSTKKNNTNFGLGLSYCYNVMQKHGGSIEISSILGSGTTVTLLFALPKIDAYKKRRGFI